MTVIGWVQILVYCAIIVAITPVLGAYMTRVFSGERTFLCHGAGSTKGKHCCACLGRLHRLAVSDVSRAMALTKQESHRTSVTL
jgi:hypothetical protein